MIKYYVDSFWDLTTSWSFKPMYLDKSDNLCYYNGCLRECIFLMENRIGDEATMTLS